MLYTLCVVDATESEVPYYSSRVGRICVVVEYEIIGNCGSHGCREVDSSDSSFG